MNWEDWEIIVLEKIMNGTINESIFIMWIL